MMGFAYDDQEAKSLLEIIRAHDGVKLDKFLFSLRRGIRNKVVAAALKNTNKKQQLQTAKYQCRLYETIMAKNEENVHRLFKMIIENEYDRGWQPEYMQQEAFLEIATIPIFLPKTYPDLLSGEFILFLLYPDKIEFNLQASNKNSDYTPYFETYQRFFGASIANYRDSLAGQIEKYIGISLRDWKHTTKGTDWRLLAMYKSLKELCEPLTDQLCQKSWMRYFIYERYGLFIRLNFEITNREKAILFFRTVLYQMVSEKYRGDVYDKINLLETACGNMCYLIQNIMISLATARRMNLSRYAELLGAELAEAKEVQQKLQSHRGAQCVCYVKDQEMLFQDVLLSSWYRENIIRMKTSYVLLADSLKAYPLHADEAYCKILSEATSRTGKNVNRGMGVLTYASFIKQYGQWIALIFPQCSDEDLKGIWGIAVKNIVYLYNKRFGFEISKNGTNDLKCKTQMPKTPVSEWYGKNNIDIGRIRADELVSMMMLVWLAKKGEFSEWSYITAQRKKKNLYFVLDNIRSTYDDVTAQRIKRLLDICQNSFLFKADEKELYQTMLSNCYQCCREGDYDSEKPYIDTVICHIEVLNDILSSKDAVLRACFSYDVVSG